MINFQTKIIENTSNIDQQNSLVIDITYNCNSNCLYCQWGDSSNVLEEEVEFSELIISEKYLLALGTNRIVFSGGEPLLHRKLTELIDYYNKMNIESIILMTNGILLDISRLKKLLSAGLTGVTISLDSLNSFTAKKTRDLPYETHQRILQNLGEIIEYKKEHDFELGINCVLTAENLSFENMKEIVSFCIRNDVDFLKFQPVFDDGFLMRTAPHLRLSNNYSQILTEIGEYVCENLGDKTNNLEFWKTLVEILSGKKLLGKSCGLDQRQSILILGQLKFCYWLDKPIYTSTPTEDSNIDVNQIRTEFKKAKINCKTGLYCFCLQSLNHVWELSK